MTKGTHSSSYTPQNERLSKEQLKQKRRDGIADARTGEIRTEEATW